MDPVTAQNVTLFTAEGQQAVFQLEDFDTLLGLSVSGGMLFSAQAAMSVLLICIVYVLTKSEKRKTTLFIINMLSLACIAVRGFLQTNYYSGNWTKFAVQFGLDFSQLRQSDYNNQLAAAAMPVFIIFFVLVSLILQMRILLCNSPKWRASMTYFATFLGLTTLAFWVIAVVQNCYQILNKSMQDNRILWGAPLYYTVAKLLFAISLVFFSALALSKLYKAVRVRKTLGDKSFGPMQILFIMSCQSMIVPAIFTLADFGVKYNGFSSLTQMLICFSLPLTSLWASVQSERNTEKEGRDRAKEGYNYVGGHSPRSEKTYSSMDDDENTLYSPSSIQNSPSSIRKTPDTSGYILTQQKQSPRHILSVDDLHSGSTRPTPLKSSSSARTKI